MNHLFLWTAVSTSLSASVAVAAPAISDRVYTADQNTNTVSVIRPSDDTLLGQIRLGNQRPDILSPLYKGEINVHGLGFSPDHKTLIAISNGSNSVTFIDTATNKVRGVAYIGRSPHEAFFTADGSEVWAVVRGENYISVIDPTTFKELRRIETAPGPGMVLFHPNGKLAFAVSSFTAEVAVIDVAQHLVIDRIPVVSPFSPFLQFTPDGKEIWMCHKDVGKVTRIDTETFKVKEVFDTGFITNHLGFAKTARGVFAYIAIGGENVVKVFSTDVHAQLVNTIRVGALPHGVWPSDDGTRMYVGLENGDGVQVVDTVTDEVMSRIAVGQAPQALVYVSNAVPIGPGTDNLAPLANDVPINIALKAVTGDAKGFVVARNLGLVDSLEVFLFKLKPQTVYNVFIDELRVPIAILKTKPDGSSNATVIGPQREISRLLSDKKIEPAAIFVVESTFETNVSQAVLVSSERARLDKR